jgi:hypothetical protein
LNSEAYHAKVWDHEGCSDGYDCQLAVADLVLRFTAILLPHRMGAVIHWEREPNSLLNIPVERDKTQL